MRATIMAIAISLLAAIYVAVVGVYWRPKAGKEVKHQGRCVRSVEEETLSKMEQLS